MASVNMVHVPYRGGAPALTDLLGGQVQVAFWARPPAIEYIKSGKLRALAVTTATRWKALPDLPTVGDVLPGYEASAWFGVGAPKNTPAQIVDKLNEDHQRWSCRSQDQGTACRPGRHGDCGSPADFSKLIADETEKWAKVIRAASIKPE